MARCNRCGKETFCTIGSMFNTEMICMECKDKERAHPSYARAREAEVNACKQGNYNFEGIGLPADLR